MENPDLTTMPSIVKVFVIRLRPHEDLRQSLQHFAASHKISAAVILSCAGSLENYNLRFANQPTGSTRRGFFEIVSLSGTLSRDSAHLHIAISDETGATTGGHLLNNNLIYTTAEIAIGVLPEIEFTRVFDSATGYSELQILSARD